MKNILLLLLLAFIIHNALGQTTEYKDLILSVEKKPINNQTSSIFVLKFKPGKLLQIKTVDGRKLASKKYFLQDSAILMIRQSNIAAIKIDTIFLKEIASIKGAVYDDNQRKMMGGVILAASLPLGTIPILISAWVGGPVFLIAIPFVGTSIAGISMLGARRFNTTDKWELKVIDR
jgi:hypothetical protein